MANYTMNLLPEDPVEAEQMLFDMLAEAISVGSWTRQKYADITKQPPALGFSPEVSAIIPEAERLGVVWDIRPDGLLFVAC